MRTKVSRFAELAWIIGVILCPLGVCLSAKSGFGVSMIVAPAYILYFKLYTIFPWFTFGIAEYCLQGMLIIVTAIIMNRFKWKYLLSFVTTICYGFMLDVWFKVLGEQLFQLLWQRVISSIVGQMITALAIAFFLRTYLPQQAYELFVKELVEHFQFNLTKFKWIYDITSLVVAIVLMYILFQRFATNIVGINTLLATLINAPLIGFFGTMLDKRFEFTSAYQSFHNKFQELMN